jgi:phage virion morphogenesis protein
MGPTVTQDLSALEDWATVLLNRLDSNERRKFMGTLAQELRRSQRQRITAQRNPDGTAFAPRKPKQTLRGKQGRIKSKMFTKLRTARYLKIQSSEVGFSVEFLGRVARMARVHQYGLKDRPERGQADVRYEARQLLGFTEQELETIRNAVIDHLAG